MDKTIANVIEVPPENTSRAYAAFCALRQGRPAMASADTFVEWVNSRQRPEGYRIVAAFLPGKPDAVAASGFRILHQLSKARYLYVDDLVTLPEFRAQGHADLLFAWLLQEAHNQGCEQLHLDSGHGRYDAHRFYLNHGMRMNAHHFSMDVR
jgi:GNAT superfamily N-acetyltransferase